MKKAIFILSVFALTLTTFAQTNTVKFYWVHDLDGYANVRAGAGTNYEIIDKIVNDFKVSRNFNESITNGWITIEYIDTTFFKLHRGYIHESRLSPHNEDYYASFRIILPKESVIDIKKRAYCQRVVDKINNSVFMTLKCDTLKFEQAGVSYEFKGIYFDGLGQLRKYVYKHSVRDGAYDYIVFSAYYNENGELVYLYCETASTCDGVGESYYVHNGKIVDFAFDYDCDCCEYSNEEYEAYVNSAHPVVGNDLIKTIGWKLLLKNFIHTDTLLTILKKEEYSGYDEIENEK